MTSSGPHVDPDFTTFKRSCSIDFVKFHSTTTAALSITPARLRIKPLRAEGHDGMLVTIHDPTIHDILLMQRDLPGATVAGLEVFFDFTPKGSLTSDAHHLQIETVRQWVLTHLYPWQGKGIESATRVSHRPLQSSTVYSDAVERRAMRHETMYFGHSDSKYAHHSKPNYASMRLYRKVTDKIRPPKPKQHRCRLELTLNSQGCRYFGLTSPDSLFGFEFRRLGEYFRFVKPEVKTYVMRKQRKTNPRMAELLERTRMRMAAQTLREVGAHSASEEKLINVDGRHRHKVANRMVQTRLDDLTRKFKKSPSSV